MKRSIAAFLGMVIWTTCAQAQTTIYWKKDYIRDASGAAIAVATPAPSDTTAPDVPTDLSASPNSSSPTTAVDLSWTGSSDNSGGIGMAGYVIYRGAVPVGAVSSTTTGFTDVGLTPKHGICLQGRRV